MKLVQRTACELSDIAEEWDEDILAGDLDCLEALEDAVQTVREDHDERVLVDTDGVWVLEVSWNEKTDDIWVGSYGYRGGYGVIDGEGGEGS